MTKNRRSYGKEDEEMPQAQNIQYTTSQDSSGVTQINEPSTNTMDDFGTNKFQTDRSEMPGEPYPSTSSIPEQDDAEIQRAEDELSAYQMPADQQTIEEQRILSTEESDNCHLPKVNPTSASIFHKYKSALKSQSGDRITLKVQPEKCVLQKPDPRKSLYLPPEIRKKINALKCNKPVDSASIKEQDLEVESSKSCEETLKIVQKPCYNANVDFHRKITPSPPASLMSSGTRRWRHQWDRKREWNDREGYGWDFQDWNVRHGGYSRGGYRGMRRLCWYGRQWYQYGTERNPAYQGQKGLWFRGRSPNEGRLGGVRKSWRNYYGRWRRFGSCMNYGKRERNESEKRQYHGEKCEHCSRDYSKCCCRSRKREHSKTSVRPNGSHSHSFSDMSEKRHRYRSGSRLDRNHSVSRSSDPSRSQDIL